MRVAVMFLLKGHRRPTILRLPPQKSSPVLILIPVVEIPG